MRFVNAELVPGSGVDYREPACYAPGPSPTIDQQAQLATAPAAVQPPAPVMQPPPPPPPAPQQPAAAPVGEMILRGLQSPFAGLSKLFGQYNLFG